MADHDLFRFLLCVVETRSCYFFPELGGLTLIWQTMTRFVFFCVVETTTLPTKKFQFAFDFLLGASTLRLAVIHFFGGPGGAQFLGASLLG